MRKNTLLTVFVFGLLLAGSAWATTKNSSGNVSKVMKMSGTVVSSSSSELVLSAKSNGKSEQEKFVVNPQTKTKGTLAAGERAIVHYKSESGQKVATMISAEKPPASKSK